ncbi:hypothetical protein ACIBCH_09840 [Amycolatopsis thailandensis]|uniref:hypothetical protein n=1 Tax=Amycolatopsis thailandensis TaxID=589330 RepID=UPI003792938D
MARVKIRKVNGRWTSTTPGYGFNGQPKTQTHESYLDAINTTARRGHVSSGSAGSTDLANQPVDQAAWVHQRPIHW